MFPDIAEIELVDLEGFGFQVVDRCEITQVGVLAARRILTVQRHGEGGMIVRTERIIAGNGVVRIEGIVLVEEDFFLGSVVSGWCRNAGRVVLVEVEKELLSRSIRFVTGSVVRLERRLPGIEFAGKILLGQAEEVFAVLVSLTAIVSLAVLTGSAFRLVREGIGGRNVQDAGLLFFPVQYGHGELVGQREVLVVGGAGRERIRGFSAGDLVEALQGIEIAFVPGRPCGERLFLLLGKRAAVENVLFGEQLVEREVLRRPGRRILPERRSVGCLVAGIRARLVGGIRAREGGQEVVQIGIVSCRRLVRTRLELIRLEREIRAVIFIVIGFGPGCGHGSRELFGKEIFVAEVFGEIFVERLVEGIEGELLPRRVVGVRITGFRRVCRLVVPEQALQIEVGEDVVFFARFSRPDLVLQPVEERTQLEGGIVVGSFDILPVLAAFLENTGFTAERVEDSLEAVYVLQAGHIPPSPIVGCPRAERNVMLQGLREYSDEYTIAEKMRNHKTIAAAFLFLLAAASVLSGADLSDLELHLTITGMTEAAAPQELGGYLIFSYRPDQAVRVVGASFAHEDYRNVHVYLRNEHGVYVLVVPVPKDVERIRYRMVVDSLWIPDPANPDRVRDDTGIALSQVTLARDRTADEPQGTELLGAGRVRFVFRGKPGSRVSIAGDFNNWDPFMHRLTEIRPGLYSITLRMRPGKSCVLFSA